MSIIYIAPIFKVRNGIIKRNLSNYVWLLPEIPQDRNAAWDSELPFWVKWDINYAQKKGYSVEYSYKNDSKITVNVEDGMNYLEVNPSDASYVESIRNVSFYKDENNNPVMYGYYDDWFGKYEWSTYSFYENAFHFSTETYDYNVPFDKNHYNSVRNGRFSLAA